MNSGVQSHPDILDIVMSNLTTAIGFNNVVGVVGAHAVLSHCNALRTDSLCKWKHGDLMKLQDAPNVKRGKKRKRALDNEAGVDELFTAIWALVTKSKCDEEQSTKDDNLVSDVDSLPRAHALNITYDSVIPGQVTPDVRNMLCQSVRFMNRDEFYRLVAIHRGTKLECHLFKSRIEVYESDVDVLVDIVKAKGMPWFKEQTFRRVPLMSCGSKHSLIHMARMLCTSSDDKFHSPKASEVEAMLKKLVDVVADSYHRRMVTDFSVIEALSTYGSPLLRKHAQFLQTKSAYNAMRIICEDGTQVQQYGSRFARFVAVKPYMANFVRAAFRLHQTCRSLRIPLLYELNREASDIPNKLGGCMCHYILREFGKHEAPRTDTLGTRSNESISQEFGSFLYDPYEFENRKR